MLDVVKLKEYLSYNPETGYITWIQNNGRQRTLGNKAGWVDNLGYIRILFFGKHYKAHRLAFMFMGREIPKVVDHINGNRSDNRWCNLREATTQQNSINTRSNTKNSTGYRGVRFGYKGKYRATIQTIENGKNVTINVGTNFSSPEEAHKAYKEKMREMFGEYCPY